MRGTVAAFVVAAAFAACTAFQSTEAPGPQPSTSADAASQDAAEEAPVTPEVDAGATVRCGALRCPVPQGCCVDVNDGGLTCATSADACAGAFMLCSDRSECENQRGAPGSVRCAFGHRTTTWVVDSASCVADGNCSDQDDALCDPNSGPDACAGASNPAHQKTNYGGWNDVAPAFARFPHCF
jgi:hypothetical protein